MQPAIQIAYNCAACDPIMLIIIVSRIALGSQLRLGSHVTLLPSFASFRPPTSGQSHFQVAVTVGDEYFHVASIDGLSLGGFTGLEALAAAEGNIHVGLLRTYLVSP